MYRFAFCSVGFLQVMKNIKVCVMGGGKGKKDVTCNVKLTTNFILICSVDFLQVMKNIKVCVMGGGKGKKKTLM
jgi:hypothetical protein